MTATFTALLFAHVLADFVLQPARMATNKGKPLVLLLHTVIVLVTALAATGQPVSLAPAPLLALAGLALVHGLTDLVKARVLPPKAKGTLAAFLGDQAAHILTLVVVSALVPSLWSGGLWSGVHWLPGLMALVAGSIIATRAGGFAIALLMQRFAETELPPGLRDGGKIIGLLERGMILVLVLVNQPAAIGFLIAAKSILRFETTSGDQKASEYVIIGTLASFGWALLAAYATVALMNNLPPLGILPVLP